MLYSFIIGCFIIAGNNELSAQSLEIHQIGLSDGDASLVIAIDSTVANLPLFPSKADTTVILIDAHRPYPAPLLYDYVDSILRKKLRRPVLDFAVVSHMHFDHYGGMKDVINELIKRGNSVGCVIDRLNAGGLSLAWPPNPADTCYDDMTLPDLSRAGAEYEKYMRENSSKGYFRWESPPVSANLLHNKNLRNISMTCLAIGGLCYQADGSTGSFIPLIGASYIPKNENDLSLVFLLQFQGFRYFTGGDIGGGGTYSDGETPISSYLRNAYGPNFHVCAFKVSHHGSRHSTNDNFMANMNPTLAIVPASARSYRGSKLPTSATINKLIAARDSIRYTFIPGKPDDPVDNWWLSYYQDVILVISSPPGTGLPINMQVTRRPRYMFTKQFTGTDITETITCRKIH